MVISLVLIARCQNETKTIASLAGDRSHLRGTRAAQPPIYRPNLGACAHRPTSPPGKTACPVGGAKT